MSSCVRAQSNPPEARRAAEVRHAFTMARTQLPLTVYDSHRFIAKEEYVSAKHYVSVEEVSSSMCL
jgi:hypothetical protein